MLLDITATLAMECVRFVLLVISALILLLRHCTASQATTQLLGLLLAPSVPLVTTALTKKVCLAFVLKVSLLLLAQLHAQAAPSVKFVSNQF